MEEQKTEEKKSEKNFIDKIRENPWMFSTAILGIFVLVLLIIFLKGGVTGSSISESEIGEKAVNFINSDILAGTGNVTLVSVAEKNGLYEVVVDYEGNNVSTYFTQDGDYYLGTSIAAVTASVISDVEEESTEVQKSSKPVVELFVMSYCPYGTQAEKGILPVVELLGDKINFSIKYVYYAMHGEKEITENLREYCIQKIAEDKFVDYMNCFLEGNGVVSSSGYITEGNDASSCIAKAGIDTTQLNSCIASADTEFSVTKNLEDESLWLSGTYPMFNVNLDLNEEYGIGGSPTLIINGVEVSAGRDSASYLSAICSAFTDAPEECDEVLSSETPSVYFGWDSTSSSSTTASCG